MFPKSTVKKRTPWLIGVVVVWFAGILLGISYLLQARLVWFDAEGSLMAWRNSGHLSSELVKELKAQGHPVAGTAFHITSDGCTCNWRSFGHVSSIQRQVEATGGRNVELAMSEFTDLKEYVPATPAVILFNEAGELIYLGPYADGAFCTTESSFVEGLIPSLSVSEPGPGWVNTVAKGCYCPVQ